MTTSLTRRSGIARTWVPAVAGVAAIALAAAGCGSSSGAQHASGAYGASQTKARSIQPSLGATTGGSSAATAATVKLADSKLGKILVDSKGDTLYLFQADTGTASTCYSACAAVWPPLTTSSEPIAGPGVAAAKLGMTKRSDGTSEVTFNGHPLYTFAGDSSRGQTTGEGNKGFGAEWDVLSAAGNKIEVDD